MFIKKFIQIIKLEGLKMLWNEKYETGNADVDSQHQELFRLVTKVIDKDTLSDKKEKIETVLGFLFDYAVRHFSSEEALMRESDYPAYEQHKNLHDGFVKNIIIFMNQFKKEGDTNSVVEVVNNFVIKWVDEHITGHDKAMADYYKNWELSK
jgi:hemerythrin